MVQRQGQLCPQISDISEPRPASLETHPGGEGEWELGRGWRRGEWEPLCTGAPLWHLSWLQASMPVVPHGGGGWSPGREDCCVTPSWPKRGGGEVSHQLPLIYSKLPTQCKTRTALKEEKKRNSS